MVQAVGGFAGRDDRKYGKERAKKQRPFNASDFLFLKDKR
jgi:hypothetical protein